MRREPTTQCFDCGLLARDTETLDINGLKAGESISLFSFRKVLRTLSSNILPCIFILFFYSVNHISVVGYIVTEYTLVFRKSVVLLTSSTRSQVNR